MNKKMITSLQVNNLHNLTNGTYIISVQVSAPDSTTNEKDKPESLYRETEPVKLKTTEADRIAEYLNRGDTAVIFPEPVRDDHDTQNEEGMYIYLSFLHCIVCWIHYTN